MTALTGERLEMLRAYYGQMYAELERTAQDERMGPATRQVAKADAEIMRGTLRVFAEHRSQDEALRKAEAELQIIEEVMLPDNLDGSVYPRNVVIARERIREALLTIRALIGGGG